MEKKIPNKPFRFILFTSKPFKWWALGATLCVIVASLLTLSLSYFFKLMVDAVETGDYERTLFFALMFPVVSFVATLVERLSGHLGKLWTISVAKYTYDQLTAYTLLHSHSYFTNRFAGALMSKIINITSSAEQIIPTFLWTHLGTIVSVFGTLTLIFLIDVSAGFIFLGLIIVLLAYNLFLAPKKARRSIANAHAKSDLRAYIVDIITNVQAVRQFTRADFEGRQVNSLSQHKFNTANVNWGFTEFMLLTNGIILFIFSFSMFWVLIESWRAGNITTGDLVLVAALFANLVQTLLFIGRAFNDTAQRFGELREGLDTIVIPHEIVDAKNATKLEAHGGKIDWKAVDFSFDNIKVFDDFTLTIEPGQKLGLVGHSGAGKTTFVSLLLRQHELNGGVIEIDGQNIAEVTQDSLRGNITVVPQEPLLFHRSIRENILYGKPDATEEEMIEVAKKAQAHDFIMKLPEGYETLVGERGVKLSGGQKQRVAIARAMLKDAPILVLDEATSALDSESEVLIQKALESLMEGKTVIAVAHRLSTLRKMDRIIVLEDGDITEDGSHEVLAQSGGVYQKLWEHQAGGFITE